MGFMAEEMGGLLGDTELRPWLDALTGLGMLVIERHEARPLGKIGISDMAAILSIVIGWDFFFP